MHNTTSAGCFSTAWVLHKTTSSQLSGSAELPNKAMLAPKPASETCTSWVGACPKMTPWRLRWFGKAAAQGNADAQNYLGLLHAFGRGTPQDDAAAVEWFRKAAEQGHAGAQDNLGLMYQGGRALPKDEAQALQWFRSAAKQGHADAQFRVGQAYAKGEVVAKDDEQAVLWFRQAAGKGHPEAKNFLQALCGGGLQAACSP